MSFTLVPEREKSLEQVLARYPTAQAACIPALHLCQEQHGWVSPEVIEYVARRLDLPTAHVLGVATFYSLFHTTPTGRHQIWVCRTLSCALGGSEQILKHCEKRLGIRCGETTPDGAITLRSCECLASCGTAPAMQVGHDYHENLSIESVDAVLDQLLQGKGGGPDVHPGGLGGEP
ncbi:MAG: NADH-quinone oxidoreductase subunit NuoE [Deltaproteobacteria bacterium]|nr:NADH-quinone oxidoreductase subunit NuoE [Deltaproteobacteria bacterium]